MIVHKYIQNANTLSYNADKCVGCKRCTEVCPHRVFVMNDKKAKIKDKDLCMECGACALNCPAFAVKVEAGVGCASLFINKFFRGSSCDECC